MPAFSRKINVEIDWIDQESRDSFEIHGTLDDNVHSLDARLTVSYPGFIILDAKGEITRMPYDGICTGAINVVSKFVGERIGRGFKRRAGEIVGGAESCNHLHTLINDMAACAFQMNYVAASSAPFAKEFMKRTADNAGLRRLMVLDRMPQLRNSCYVFSEANDSLFQTLEKTKPGGSADEPDYNPT
jgi:hypothetical protein